MHTSYIINWLMGLILQEKNTVFTYFIASIRVSELTHCDFRTVLMQYIISMFLFSLFYQFFII